MSTAARWLAPWWPKIWYERHPLGVVLAPLGWVFRLAVALRRSLYRVGVLPVIRVDCPVIVIGNIAVGGTGKTPLVAWVASALRDHGLRPGIVSRGYGGDAVQWPQRVVASSDPAAVGDEPVLLAARTGCPVAAGPDRVAACHALIEDRGCDVIVSDDGLQHYRLGRDVEVVVIDGIRRHGNGRCLPAGPLREPVARLRGADLLVANSNAGPGEFEMNLIATRAVSLADPAVTRPLEDFSGARVHAVCGIGNPRRFFALLEHRGIAVVPHVFPDHHRFGAADLDIADGCPVLMTEKDAVKCRAFARPGLWYVPVDASLPPAFAERLIDLLGSAGPGA